MLFFVTACGWGLSLLSGACTLAIMVLPVIMRTTEEALMAVPDSYREGGFGLGAGRLRTVARCVLPSAVPGILGGVILALGRCVGEVAALLFTAGTVAQIPDFGGQGIFALFDSCRTLAVHMYTLACEGPVSYTHLRETTRAAAQSSHCHTSQTTVKQALQVFGADALPKLFETDGGSLRALLGSFTERGHHGCTKAIAPLRIAFAS